MASDCNNGPISHILDCFENGKNILLLKKTRVLLKKKYSRLLLKKGFEQKYDFFFGTFAQKHKIKSCVNRVLKYALQWEITHETPAAALRTLSK